MQFSGPVQTPRCSFSVHLLQHILLRICPSHHKGEQSLRTRIFFEVKCVLGLSPRAARFWKSFSSQVSVTILNGSWSFIVLTRKVFPFIRHIDLYIDETFAVSVKLMSLVLLIKEQHRLGLQFYQLTLYSAKNCLT